MLEARTAGREYRRSQTRSGTILITGSTTASRNSPSRRNRGYSRRCTMNLRHVWYGPLLCILTAASSHSIGVSNLHIENLVRASDVVAVVEVADIKPTGSAPPI